MYRVGIGQSEYLPAWCHTVSGGMIDSGFEPPPPLPRPLPAHRYVAENDLAAMLATKRSAGVKPEVNLRECIKHIAHMPSMNEAAPCGFEFQMRHHQKSKTGVLVAPNIST